MIWAKEKKFFFGQSLGTGPGWPGGTSASVHLILSHHSVLLCFSAMDSTSSEVVQDFSPLIKVYKDGRVERLVGCELVPPSLDPATNVESKDIVISKDDNVSARIFLPKLTNPNQKLPLLVYFHGGGFCVGTPFSPHYHNFLNTIVSQARVVGISVHYRRAPEHPVPIAFEDSWTSLKWVASHCGGNGPDEWLNRHADFGKVFISGDSAGGTIAHQMGIRVGAEGLPGINLEGIVLVHSYFWGVERIGSESEQPELAAFMGNLWRFTCPSSTGYDDPFLNPAKDPNLGKLGCKRMLVCVAGNDILKDRSWYYKESLEKSEWKGVVEVVESKGEDHVFHLLKPNFSTLFGGVFKENHNQAYSIDSLKKIPQHSDTPWISRSSP
ncbi:probable carboxylesterase 12 [Lotus japonicus]|uniref:probable carboxylesterase 12 n=1 Tax=Lotus japonicus TaxID=34305 RepID=UPI00258AAFBD|nr:probable carboxylesterase 12 [Lotus japonicus]XP_057419564.1 probable carboxylesterase 12 [Lotus japonicus]XP_057419565.1 probable carboxylesterase 12 [Lotus japonicus]